MTMMLWCAAAFVPLVLVGGWLYQCVGGWLDRRRLLSAGQRIDIGGGRELYFIERGEGGPSVIFESGFAATSLNWVHIQNRVARHVHTVSYDRCGLGWSGPSKSERTPTEIAAELRDLLHAAGIPPPYVLVGHSFGGLVVRRYALNYPDEVAGVVLVDPMRTHEWPPVNAPRQATLEKAQRLTKIGVPIARLGMARLAVRSHLCGSAKVSGFLAGLAGAQGAYLAGRLTEEVGKMPAQVRPAIAAHWSTPGFYRGLLAHLDGVRATVAEMHETDPIGDVPVVVLTPGSAAPVPAEQMRQLGRQSRQVIAEGSQHWVHLDEPELVIETILEMVAEAGQDGVRAAETAELGAD